MNARIARINPGEYTEKVYACIKDGELTIIRMIIWMIHQMIHQMIH